MTKKLCSRTLCRAALFAAMTLPLCGLQVVAQNERPSKALRQVTERQKILREKFDREVTEGKAQTHQWESRSDEIRQLAADRAAEFKIKDWKDDELMALAALYQQAEQFASAAEALSAYLSANPSKKLPGIRDVRVGYVRMLLEVDRIEEAEKTLQEAFPDADDVPAIITSYAGLAHQMAIAFRDRRKFEQAAEWAKRGYRLADEANQGVLLESPLHHSSLLIQYALAALQVAMKEQLGQKKEAEEFNAAVMKLDSSKNPELRSFYESELKMARLIGDPAPELAATRWLDSSSKNLSELRGKVVLLDFWAMWCAPCVTAFPYLREFRSTYENKGFEIVGVTRFYGHSETEEYASRELELKGLQNYRREHQLSYPIAVGKMDDVTNEEHFNVISLPTVILIDRRGNVRYVKRGVGDYKRLNRQIAKLIDEEP